MNEKKSSMEQQPVVHHIELCVGNRSETLNRLKKFGFDVYARRETTNASQIVARLGASIFFVITERKKKEINLEERTQVSDSSLPSLLCCDGADSHVVDTVFNVTLNVTDVKTITEKVVLNGGSVIVPPRTVTDKFGHVSFAVVKSICGDVVHTLLNKSHYRGLFLPGFETENSSIMDNSRTVLKDIMTHVDHVTLACRDTSTVISFYQMCFGMRKINISLRNEEEEEGLVLANGVGIRLRAMEYYRCQETGLIYSPSSPRRDSNSTVMFVVVESLPGQTNCNVETFLREHQGPGVEHVALSTKNMYRAVSLMSEMGCIFRKPPNTYYNELRKNVDETGEDIAALRKLGILLDKEPDSEENVPKYLMQIFSLPIFSRKTFFIEVIHRHGAKGLGAGNIIALVRSIREEERLKLAEQEKMETARSVS